MAGQSGSNPRLTLTGQSTFAARPMLYERLGDNASNEAKFRELRPYSVRKACIGSRREARQAGKMQANKAIKRRVRITVPITAGSVGLVP
jgi:hypothetical protein